MIHLNDRRRLLVAGLILAHAPSLRAQQPKRVPVIGYLTGVEPEPLFGYFRNGMRKLGYTEGENVRIELRAAQGKIERLAAMATELLDMGVDVLVATQTPAQLAAQQATRQATTRIPIVMAGSADPVGMGLIASLARPGGNITGVASTSGELAGKSLELVRDVLPSARRVAVLVNSADPFSARFLAQLTDAGARLTMELTPVMIPRAEDVDAAFQVLAKERPDAVIVQPSLPLRRVAQLAIEHRLPTCCLVGNFPGEGGLMSYAPDQTIVFEIAATYVDRILKGARPADLPVQQPTRYATSINLKTARAIGLVIPKALLLRVDQVIE